MDKRSASNCFKEPDTPGNGKQYWIELPAYGCVSPLEYICLCVYGLRSTSSSNCILLGFTVFYLVSPSRSIDMRLRTFGVTIVEGHARKYSTRLFAIENSVTVACFVDSCQHKEPLLPVPVAVIDIAQLEIYVYAIEGGRSFWSAPVVCHGEKIAIDLLSSFASPIY